MKLTDYWKVRQLIDDRAEAKSFLRGTTQSENVTVTCDFADVTIPVPHSANVLTLARAHAATIVEQSEAQLTALGVVIDGEPDDATELGDGPDADPHDGHAVHPS